MADAETSGPLLVVGLGSSAEGIRVLSAFFSGLAPTSTTAYIIVQQGSAQGDRLIEVIRHHASMPVHLIEDGLVIVPGSVYIAPPHTQIQIEGRHFHCQSVLDPDALLITPLFEALAQWGKQAIGILLAGTGSDGVEGLNTIAARGGYTLVQSPETAQFSALPTQALSSGSSDEILSVPELAQTIAHLTKVLAQSSTSIDSVQDLVSPSQLQRILSILNRRGSTDFSDYKTGTLSRRILHQCSLTQSTTLDSYIELLNRSEEEQDRLRRDVLIGATRFFRDPAVWQSIETDMLPALIKTLPDSQPLRIWVPACATGEEAYTLAIIIFEVLEHLHRWIPVKIFATDLDSQALEVVSQGNYPDTIAEEISPERLNRHFFYQAGRYQVKPHLREMLIVAPHDLTQNAAFSNMHLVSCRNVLIYMQPHLQQQVLRLLHFSLIPQGILLLGSSETVSGLVDEFEVVDPKWKIFRKLRDVYLSIRSSMQHPVYSAAPPTTRPPTRQLQFEKLLGDVYQTCFEGKQLTCLLVNSRNQLLHIYADSNQLLEMPLGDLRSTITEWVPAELKLPLGTALHRAQREQQLVLYSNIKLHRHHQDWLVTLKVKPLPSLAEDPYFAVVIDLDPTQHSEFPLLPYELDAETLQQISELEFELQQTRQNLQTTLEELSTSNEEQQAINEELLASNEELQSTNEELQSVNEELQTLNADYASKIRELIQLNNDIDNLLWSTEIGVLFLDNQLRIRKFTPAITHAINLLPTDTYRPLTHLTHNLDCPDLVDLARHVISTGKSIERRVILRQTQDQQDHLLMRINPYLSHQGKQDGVVITLVDINELYQAQLQLSQLNQTLENLFNSIPVGLSLMDSTLRYIRVNQVFADMNGLPIKAHTGQFVFDLLPDFKDQLEPLMKQVIETAQVLSNQEIHGRIPASFEQERYWLASYFPIELADGSRGLGSTVTDITELKQAEISLRQSEERLQRLNQLKDDFLSTVSHELRSPLTNMRMALRLMGLADSMVKYQTYHSIALRECEHQIELINDLLDLQRLQAETFEIKAEALNLNSMITLCLESIELDHGIHTFSTTIDLIKDPFYTDRSCLQRILSELLHNAVKYTKPQGSIHISAQRVDPQRFDLEVANTGEIPQEELSRIFDRFYRIPTQDQGQRGTGLGLALVKGMVKDLKGQIIVTSEAGWIRFQVWLPNHPPQPDLDSTTLPEE